MGVNLDGYGGGGYGGGGDGDGYGYGGGDGDGYGYAGYGDANERFPRSMNDFAYQPSTTENREQRTNMKFEAKPLDPDNSPFVKFVNIGDKVRGSFIKYGGTNKFGKPEILIRDRNGDQKIINCGADLKRKFEDNAMQLPALKGKILTITLIELKDTGKENKMPVFDVDWAEPGAKKPVTTQVADAGSDGDDPIPF
jgi:hypothetical protein